MVVFIILGYIVFVLESKEDHEEKKRGEGSEPGADVVPEYPARGKLLNCPPDFIHIELGQIQGLKRIVERNVNHGCCDLYPRQIEEESSNEKDLVHALECLDAEQGRGDECQSGPKPDEHEYRLITLDYLIDRFEPFKESAFTERLKTRHDDDREDKCDASNERAAKRRDEEGNREYGHDDFLQVGVAATLAA